MKKESLIELKDMITNYLMNNKIMDKADNLELTMNMNCFLSPERYDENVKILRIEQDKRKWDRYV